MSEPRFSLGGVERSSRIPKGIPKEYRELLELAKEQGWLFSEGKGYPKAWPPDRKTRPIAIPKTPGNPNLLMGIRAEFQRAGLKLPPR
jgi:hypothetical protein